MNKYHSDAHYYRYAIEKSLLTHTPNGDVKFKKIIKTFKSEKQVKNLWTKHLLN